MLTDLSEPSVPGNTDRPHSSSSYTAHKHSSSHLELPSYQLFLDNSGPPSLLHVINIVIWLNDISFIILQAWATNYIYRYFIILQLMLHCMGNLYMYLRKKGMFLKLLWVIFYYGCTKSNHGIHKSFVLLNTLLLHVPVNLFHTFHPRSRFLVNTAHTCQQLKPRQF